MLWALPYLAIPDEQRDVSRVLETLPLADLPHLAEHIRQHLDDQPGDTSEFEFGLDLLLDGLERLRVAQNAEGGTVDLDTLIVGADVIDGTGAPRRAADVGIRDGRIVAIAARGALADSAAATTIDAAGQVLAPGFIDIHTHSDVTLLDNPGGESKAYQGVTTEVTGNCSYSPFPVGAPGPEPMRGLMRSALDTSLPWTWTDLDGWAGVHEAAGMSINLAPLVGHSAVRFAAGLADDRPPRADELQHMQRLVAESVEQGAFGMSTGLTLPPSSYAATDEIVALASAMTAYPGAFYATHARVWGGNHVGAVEEAAEIGRRAGVPVEFSHIAIIDTRVHGHPEQLIDVIDRALAGGQDLTADVYPYTAAGTGLNQFLPEWAQEGGPEDDARAPARPGDAGEGARGQRQGLVQGAAVGLGQPRPERHHHGGEPPSAREVPRGSRGRPGRGPARHVPEPDRRRRTTRPGSWPTTGPTRTCAHFSRIRRSWSGRTGTRSRPTARTGGR